VVAEHQAMVSSMVAKTITGDYSMDDFDAQLKEWEKKFVFMDDTWTKIVTENKAKLKSYGVTSVDW